MGDGLALLVDHRARHAAPAGNADDDPLLLAGLHEAVRPRESGRRLRPGRDGHELDPGAVEQREDCAPRGIRDELVGLLAEGVGVLGPQAHVDAGHGGLVLDRAHLHDDGRVGRIQAEPELPTFAFDLAPDRQERFVGHDGRLRIRDLGRLVAARLQGRAFVGVPSRRPDHHRRGPDSDRESRLLHECTSSQDSKRGNDCLSPSREGEGGEGVDQAVPISSELALETSTQDGQGAGEPLANGCGGLAATFRDLSGVESVEVAEEDGGSFRLLESHHRLDDSLLHRNPGQYVVRGGRGLFLRRGALAQGS